MNMKINTICFILLFFALITAASATDSDNETLKTINQPDYDQDIDSEGKLQMNTHSDEVLSKSVENDNVVSSSEKTVLASKATYHSVTPVKANVKVNMKAPNVKMHYKDGTKFKVTLKDNKKKAMKNTKIKITIDGTTYSRKTDSKGVATLALNLKSGTYKVVSTYAGSSQFAKKSVNSKVTIKSTIKCSDFTKYYKNTASYYSTFYDKKGKLLKNTAVKFKLNGKTYSVKTNKKGVGKVALDLKPGKYGLSSINSKTSETVTKTVTIKSLIETSDLTMKDGDGSRFKVKILNSYGKASPNKKVTIKINGQTFTQTTDKNGMASIPLDYDVGQYSVTTEYDGLKNTNKITINKALKHTTFSHVTLIPNYVNVTVPYGFHNSDYTVKTGVDGIVKLPKNEVFTVQVGGKAYRFSTSTILGIDSIVLGYKTHFIPFDGSGVKSDYNKANLKGDGILITKMINYTKIECRNTNIMNTDMFGVNIDKFSKNTERIVYAHNNGLKAQINFITYEYDEMGLKYNLAKYYGKNINDFNIKSYDEVTDHNMDKVKFTNCGKPINHVDKLISTTGYIPEEDILTKFIVNGAEEYGKEEHITYGHGEDYELYHGFEAIQSYAIINEKVTKDIVEKWMGIDQKYRSNFNIIYIYGMFMAGLETAWLADEIADHYAKELDVVWKRGSTATILGGINTKDTYLHILNADMGMKVMGNDENIELFKYANSINLPNIEEYALKPLSGDYNANTTNSMNDVFSAIANGNYSITQLGEMLYVFNGNESAFALNTTSGVCSVLLSSGKSVYKGSKISTNTKGCGLCNAANDIYNALSKLTSISKPGMKLLTDMMNDANSYVHTVHTLLSYSLGKLVHGASGSLLAIYGFMAMAQRAGSSFKQDVLNEKDWHTAMDIVTFTRPGYFQDKKVYNIPNKNGGMDYIEVEIKKDGSLNRNNAKYISKGQTKTLTKKETYKYFTDEHWTPFSMPKKYWDKSWK
ncbi:hypothetical protein [uncultured Methanobrevibacter sp.]|uniref:hypothetical protein n=1 Tax=uncultured Methanobrevibacter sp. TaxID=253161 RepID=UPI0025CFB161|nr:hypothetical protein [uncultured Methanobrevibacter sp.]